MDIASPVHSIRPRFDNDSSSTENDTKFFCTEFLVKESNAPVTAYSSASLSLSPTVTLVESSSADDHNDLKSCDSVTTSSTPVTIIDCSPAAPPSWPAHDSSSMLRTGAKGLEVLISPSSHEAASNVTVSIVDTSSSSASSITTTVKLSPRSSNVSIDGSALMQGSGSPSYNPMTSSQMSNFVSHNVNGNHQQPCEFEGPTGATGIQNSSKNHNTQRRHMQHGGDSYGNRDWNIHRRSFNGRNMHMPLRSVPRFIRPLPPPPYPFSQYFPPSVPPYGGAYRFPGFGPHFSYSAANSPLQPPSPVPYMPQIPPYLTNVPTAYPEPSISPNVPAADPELCVQIVRQIDYYFSFDNLIKDIYLRKQMDQQGWVPVTLIATFPKVKELTSNIQIILDALQTSSVVEILGDKIRRRLDWQRWVIPESYQLDIPKYERQS